MYLLFSFFTAEFKIRILKGLRCYSICKLQKKPATVSWDNSFMGLGIMDACTHTDLCYRRRTQPRGPQSFIDSEHTCPLLLRKYFHFFFFYYTGQSVCLLSALKGKTISIFSKCKKTRPFRHRETVSLFQCHLL